VHPNAPQYTSSSKRRLRLRAFICACERMCRYGGVGGACSVPFIGHHSASARDRVGLQQPTVLDAVEQRDGSPGVWPPPTLTLLLAQWTAFADPQCEPAVAAVNVVTSDAVVVPAAPLSQYAAVSAAGGVVDINVTTLSQPLPMRTWLRAREGDKSVGAVGGRDVAAVHAAQCGATVCAGLQRVAAAGVRR
jgi:hypothetical protein